MTAIQSAELLERRREAGRRGGLAAHKKGTSRVFTSEEARVAGLKGAAARKGTGRPRGVTKRQGNVLDLVSTLAPTVPHLVEQMRARYGYTEDETRRALEEVSSGGSPRIVRHVGRSGDEVDVEERTILIRVLLDEDPR